jgi:hypothetical protein
LLWIIHSKYLWMIFERIEGSFIKQNAVTQTATW